MCRFDCLAKRERKGGREGMLTWLEVTVEDALGVGVGESLEDT